MKCLQQRKVDGSIIHFRAAEERNEELFAALNRKANNAIWYAERESEIQAPATFLKFKSGIAMKRQAIANTSGMFLAKQCKTLDEEISKPWNDSFIVGASSEASEKAGFKGYRRNSHSEHNEQAKPLFLFESYY